jgi:hypothetical protein
VSADDEPDKRMDQLDLFGAPPAHPHEVVRVGPAACEAETSSVATALPGVLRLGTSSWAFPGWAGIVYDREVRSEALARHGLSRTSAFWSRPTNG